MNKCIWCDKETENEARICINGEMRQTNIALCDKCQKADDEAFQPERLSEKTQKGCDSLNSTET